MLFLVPPLILVLTRLIAKPRASGWVVAAGVISGVAVLARPNTILIGPAALVAALLIAREIPLKHRMATAALFFAAWAVAISPMYIRNYMVTGEVSFAALTKTNDWARPRRVEDLPLAERLRAEAKFHARRAAVVLGLGSRRPPIRPRPHWTAFWIGAAAAAVFWIRKRRWVPTEIACAVFLIFYLAPLMAVGHIDNYGFRMIVPAIPSLILLAFRSFRILHAESSAPAEHGL
jgi:hypothetical protein